MTENVRSPGFGTIIVRSQEGGHIDSHGYKASDIPTVKYSYPLKFIIPEYASRTNCKWIYPVTFGGGLVAGDNIEINLDIGEQCSALLTSQESTKVYHCEDPLVTSQVLQANISQDALLCVLSDPVVCYKNANFRQSQTFSMSTSGNLAFLDWMTAGRVARDECWQFQSYSNRTDIYIDNTLVFRDSVHLKDLPMMTINRSMRQYRVMGTFILLGHKFVEISSKLQNRIGRVKTHGEKTDSDKVCSVSPLKYKICDSCTVSGVYIRFLCTNTMKAYSIIADIVAELTTVLGGDPFSHKY